MKLVNKIENDGVTLRLRGECSDELWELVDDVLVPKMSVLRRNIVVTASEKVLTSGLGNLGTGIQYHAVGSGLNGGAWDPTPPAPTIGQTSLVNEYFRKTPASIEYLDEKSGAADSGGTITTLIDSTRAEPDDFFNGLRLIVTSGNNAGEDRKIVDYIGASGTFVTDPLFPFPLVNDSGSTYEVNLPTITPTNKIEITTVFEIGEGVPPVGNFMRTHGLFGLNATATLGSGSLINVINHPKIDKTALSQLTRRMRIKLVVQ